ncbi:unnamed protein product [Gadus morhua 'NCC']
MPGSRGVGEVLTPGPPGRPGAAGRRAERAVAIRPSPEAPLARWRISSLELHDVEDFLPIVNHEQCFLTYGSGPRMSDHSLPGEPRDQQSAFCILIPFIFNQSWNSLPLFLFRPLSCSNLPSSSSVICPALASPPWQPGTT